MVAIKDKNSGIVYSTEYGKMFPACGRPIEKCMCLQKSALPQGDGIVRIGLETKGRKGKSVTVITGIPLNHDGFGKLAKQLKQKCGTGGTVKKTKLLSV